VESLGVALARPLQTALQAGSPEAADLVACECLVDAETQDHADWELISKCAEKSSGKQKSGASGSGSR
jgi:hypothetical protein